MKRPQLWIRLLISGGLIASLFFLIDLEEAVDVAQEANYLYLLAAFPIFVFVRFLRSYRWRLMVQKVGSAPLMDLFGTYFMSNMANIVAPVRIGDIVRIQVPAKRHDLPRSGLTATVFVTEKLLDAVVFAAMVPAALLFLDVPGAIVTIIWIAIGSVAVLAVGGFLLSGTEPQEGWEKSGPLRMLPDSVQNFLAKNAPGFIEGMKLLRDYRLAAIAIGVTVAAWSLEVAVYALFGLALHLELGVPEYLLIMVAAHTIVSFPIVPTNFGPYEVTLTGLLVALGVGSGAAAAYAVGSHLITVIWVGIAGLIAMWAMGVGVGDVLFFKKEEEKKGG